MPDNVTPPTIAVSSATMTTGSIPGVQVSGNGKTPSTKATFTVANDLGNSDYQYGAYVGTTTDPAPPPQSGSASGESTWQQGPDDLTIYWFPVFKGANGTSPTEWTAFSSVTPGTPSGSTCTVTCGASSPNGNANMTITIQGSGGEPPL